MAPCGGGRGADRRETGPVPAKIHWIDPRRCNDDDGSDFAGDGGYTAERIRDYVKKVRAGWKPPQPIICSPRPDHRILVIDGHHRVAAAIHHGIKRIPVLDTREL